MSRELVAFFSASGTTARTAKKLAEAKGADLFEIRPVTPYKSADLNWMNKKSRSSVEMRDPASRPEIAETPDTAAYDTVYVGFPVWWYTAPHIINTFFEFADLSGKKVVLFATSGGSGIDRAVKDLKGQYPSIDITGGKLLNGSVNADSL